MGVISIVIGIINQFITGGHHLVMGSTIIHLSTGAGFRPSLAVSPFHGIGGGFDVFLPMGSYIPYITIIPFPVVST